MTEGNSAVIDIIGRQLQGDLVASKNADMIFFHLSAGIRHKSMAVIQGNAVSRVWKNFHHYAMHFDQFFFCQMFLQDVGKTTVQQ